jgi:type II secretory pathway pseudopilin PulG
MRKINTQTAMPCGKQGFTLLEILLYFAVISIILYAIMSFSLQILIVSKESSNLQEIQTNMDFIVNKITYTIQNSNSIDTGNSTFDNDTGKLSLNVPNLGKSPTSFYLETNAIYMKEGSSAAIKANSDSMKCTQLKFTKISSPKIPDQVMIDIKCEPINSEIKNLEQEVSIHTSISLRK